jgi:hypothetical protein
MHSEGGYVLSCDNHIFLTQLRRDGLSRFHLIPIRDVMLYGTYDEDHRLYVAYVGSEYVVGSDAFALDWNALNALIV